MKKYELLPVYDKSKSFYHKAIIEEEGSIKKLYSYNTLVCTLSYNDIILNDNIDQSLLFSSTTLRHIKEFLKQYHYNSDHNIAKKDLLKLL